MAIGAVNFSHLGGSLFHISRSIYLFCKIIASKIRLSGNRRDGVYMWWCLAGAARQTPPHLAMTTENPKEPKNRPGDAMI